jgi:hypothetical protein
MSNLAGQRKKVAILAASIAVLSVTVSAALKHHPRLGYAWVAIVFLALVFTLREFAKLRRIEK